MSINLAYGGVGGKVLRDSEIIYGCVDDSEIFSYHVAILGLIAYWCLEKPSVGQDAEMTKYNCRV